MKEGWLCPRCGRVNAPFATQCDCRENNKSNFSYPSKFDGHKHVYQQIYPVTGGIFFQCTICGTIEKLGATNSLIFNGTYDVPYITH